MFFLGGRLRQVFLYVQEPHLNSHADVASGARGYFSWSSSLSVPAKALVSLRMRIRRLAWAFNAKQCDKFQISRAQAGFFLPVSNCQSMNNLYYLTSVQTKGLNKIIACSIRTFISSIQCMDGLYYIL